METEYVQRSFTARIDSVKNERPLGTSESIQTTMVERRLDRYKIYLEILDGMVPNLEYNDMIKNIEYTLTMKRCHRKNPTSNIDIMNRLMENFKSSIEKCVQGYLTSQVSGVYVGLRAAAANNLTDQRSNNALPIFKVVDHII